MHPCTPAPWPQSSKTHKTIYFIFKTNPSISAKRVLIRLKTVLIVCICPLITLRRIQQQVDNYTDPWQAAFKRGRSCGDLVWCQRVLLAVVMERHWSFHKDVVIEPPLLPLTGEKLPPGSNLSDGARLDVSCINLWSPLSRAFIDVRIFNPQAQSNWNKSIPAMYTSHQNEKKTEYGPRTREVEKATLTAAVMSTSGGM